jgi:hypothetical protein
MRVTNIPSGHQSHPTRLPDRCRRPGRAVTATIACLLLIGAGCGLTGPGDASDPALTSGAPEPLSFSISVPSGQTMARTVTIGGKKVRCKAIDQQQNPTCKNLPSGYTYSSDVCEPVGNYWTCPITISSTSAQGSATSVVGGSEKYRGWGTLTSNGEPVVVDITPPSGTQWKTNPKKRQVTGTVADEADRTAQCHIELDFEKCFGWAANAFGCEENLLGADVSCVFSNNDGSAGGGFLDQLRTDRSTVDLDDLGYETKADCRNTGRNFECRVRYIKYSGYPTEPPEVLVAEQQGFIGDTEKVMVEGYQCDVSIRNDQYRGPVGDITCEERDASDLSVSITNTNGPRRVSFEVVRPQQVPARTYAQSAPVEREEPSRLSRPVQQEPYPYQADGKETEIRVSLWYTDPQTERRLVHGSDLDEVLAFADRGIQATAYFNGGSSEPGPRFWNWSGNVWVPEKAKMDKVVIAFYGGTAEGGEKVLVTCEVKGHPSTSGSDAICTDVGKTGYSRKFQLFGGVTVKAFPSGFTY